MLEFLGLVKRGVDFVAIDKAMERFGWPMGPAYLCDVVGIDTGVHAGKVMAADVVNLSWAETVQGQSLRVEIKDGNVFVDGAYIALTYESAVELYSTPGALGTLAKESKTAKDRVTYRIHAGDFEGASRAWSRQVALEGQADPDTLFDMGNANARAGRLERRLGGATGCRWRRRKDHAGIHLGLARRGRPPLHAARHARRFARACSR